MPKCQVPRIIRDIRCMYRVENRKYRQYVLEISDKVCAVVAFGNSRANQVKKMTKKKRE